MRMNGSLAAALLVGCCWGVTNTFIRVGVVQAERRRNKARLVGRPVRLGHLQRLLGPHWASLLGTPIFVVSQVSNWLASVALVAELAGGRLHVATPVANAVSVAATAITGQLVANDQMHPVLLAAGVVCIAAGVFLTSG
jgi:Putative transmembrane family 234